MEHRTQLRIVLIVLTAALASLLEILDSSIVNVAIPSMMGNIGATLNEISWVSTGYMIANSIVLPIAAWIGSRMGRKNYFTSAILIFTVASFACGIAPNLGFLIFFRILQGAAGGALLPTSQSLIQEQFPPEKAGMAMAIFGLSVMVGPALGPSIGGYLTDHFGWRSIFNINVPLGFLAASLSWWNVPDTSYTQKKSNVDWLGLGLLCLGIGCLQYVLERGETDGWDSLGIRSCSGLAFLGIAFFIYWELKIENPIMNLSLFKYNVLRSGTMLMMCLGVMLYSLTFAIPVFVASALPQMTATQVGWLFMPGSVATALFMLPVGLLVSRVSPKLLAFLGFGLGILSVLQMTQFSMDTGPREILAPLVLRGVGMAFLFIPINQMVLGAFRGEALGQVAGMQNFFRQLGGSIGIALLDTLITRFSAQNYNDLLTSVSLLNPAGYQAYVQGQEIPWSGFADALGLWNPESIALRSIHYRALGQVFVMSFQQLCWVILGVVALAFIPLYVIKPAQRSGRIMDVH